MKLSDVEVLTMIVKVREMMFSMNMNVANIDKIINNIIDYWEAQIKV